MMRPLLIVFLALVLIANLADNAFGFLAGDLSPDQTWKLDKISTTGNAAVPDNQDLAAVSLLKRGAGFTETSYQQGDALVKGYFLERGYGRVAVQRRAEVDPDKNQARITYMVDPGPITHFGTTRVEGTHDVASYIV